MTPDSTDERIKAANSLNHSGEGQNVLYRDGRAEWKITPFCWSHGDNIYTAAGPEITADGRGKAVVWASPVSDTDSIVLPAAEDISYKNAVAAADAAPQQSAAEHDALPAKRICKYHESGNDDATMTIDAITITSLATAEPLTITTK